jgi:hypothetical protein
VIKQLRKELKKVKTEIGEKNAVARFLKAHGHRRTPEVTKGTTADNRTVRMYLWRDTPAGNVCLVSGPSVEGTIYELHEHTGGKHGSVYFPGSKGKPALSDAKNKRANPQARVGKVRTDKKTGKDLEVRDWEKDFFYAFKAKTDASLQLCNPIVRFRR